MGERRNIWDDLASISEGKTVDAAAFKVNVEAAQAALKKIGQLADEIEQAYQAENGNIRRCWQCCMDGLEGESKEVMREAVEECRGQYRQIASSIRTSVAQNTQYLNALVESDRALAEAIRNA